MNLQELQNKKQQYINEKINLENEKNNYIKDLAVIENQIKINNEILMTQFGTTDPAQLQEILNNFEVELQQLEGNYSDLKSGKISASSFGDTSTQQFQNEVKPGFAPVTAPIMQPTPPPPAPQTVGTTQLVQQPNYPAEQLQPQLVQQPNFPNAQQYNQESIMPQTLQQPQMPQMPQMPQTQQTSITPPPPPMPQMPISQ